MNRILSEIIYALKSSNSKDTIKRKIKNPFLKHVFPHIKTHWKKALTASCFMVFVSLLALPTPYLMKLIVDEILIDKNINLLNLIIFLLIVVQLAKLIFSFLTNYLFNIFSQEIMVNIKKDLFYHLLCLPFSFYDKNQTGYLLSRTREVEGLNLFSSNTLVTLLIGFFEFIFCLTILFYLNWKLTLISLSFLPLFFFATRYFSQGIRRSSKEVMEKGAILTSHIQDSLSGSDVVKIFSAEKREADKIHNYLNKLKQSNIKQNIIFSFSSELLSLIGAMGGFVVLWYSGIAIIRGDFTIGSYIAFAGYLAKLYGPTYSFASIGLAFQPAIIALNRVSELMDLSGEGKKENVVKLNKIKGEIEFRHVSFSYNNKQALTDINFKIRKGEKIFITGPNGSGKSTIVKLLLGLYEPHRGIILIDNCKIDKTSITSLRERISIVTQNTFLFNDTVKNNILYSYPEASDAEIEQAARLSGAYEFINRLEKGFETNIGEIGKKLSGGEKQKLSISRALLKNSDFIIFDEPTTHLDLVSERRIERLIEENLKDKTCILISHKIKNIKLIDRIYVLKAGMILDKGKHEDLYQRCEFYKQLYNS